MQRCKESKKVWDYKESKNFVEIEFFVEFYEKKKVLGSDVKLILSIHCRKTFSVFFIPRFEVFVYGVLSKRKFYKCWHFPEHCTLRDIEIDRWNGNFSVGSRVFYVKKFYMKGGKRGGKEEPYGSLLRETYKRNLPRYWRRARERDQKMIPFSIPEESEGEIYRYVLEYNFEKKYP